jgi:hypothetical protein
MKGRLLAISSLFIVLFTASCKKEAVPGIVGKWVSEAIYQNDGNGGMAWTYSPRTAYFITFHSNGHFSTMTDVPGAGGLYTYERETGRIIMNYEATATNPVPGTSVIHVEQLTTDKLLLSSFFGPDSKMQMIKY